MAGVEQPPELSTRRVLEAIARHLGVPPHALRGRDRTREVAAARRVAIVLLRRRCNVSYRQLAALLGRHWTTVQQNDARTGRWPSTRELAEAIERMLDQESPRTRKAVEDIEETFRRAREDAGLATPTHPRPR